MSRLEKEEIRKDLAIFISGIILIMIGVFQIYALQNLPITIIGFIVNPIGGGFVFAGSRGLVEDISN